MALAEGEGGGEGEGRGGLDGDRSSCSDGQLCVGWEGWEGGEEGGREECVRKRAECLGHRQAGGSVVRGWRRAREREGGRARGREGREQRTGSPPPRYFQRAGLAKGRQTASGPLKIQTTRRQETTNRRARRDPRRG